MFKHILAATDLVEIRDPSVLAGAQIAKQHRADFHILHVPESAHTENRLQVKHFKTGEEILYSADYARTLIAAIDAAYAEILPPNVDTHIRVAPGFPWEEIISWSRQTEASMIVLGPTFRPGPGKRSGPDCGKDRKHSGRGGDEGKLPGNDCQSSSSDRGRRIPENPGGG